MFKFWYGATMLSLEAQRVIALRMMKLARAAERPGRSQPHGDGEDRGIDGGRRDADERRLRPRRRRAGAPARAVEFAPPVALN